jgi:hypothetical protein
MLISEELHGCLG